MIKLIKVVKTALLYKNICPRMSYSISSIIIGLKTTFPCNESVTLSVYNPAINICYQEGGRGTKLLCLGEEIYIEKRLNFNGGLFSSTFWFAAI